MALYNRPVAVLGSCIATADGLYHQPTNDVLTRLLGVEIPYNRGLFTHEVGQVALVCRLEGGRIPNGVQLSESELTQLGFSFKRLIRLD